MVDHGLSRHDVCLFGPGTPDHSFPDRARSCPSIGEVVHTDRGMPRRYAEVSGDFSSHHFDVAAAKRSGYESVFLHGLCTMGLCARAAVETVAGGDPQRVRRVAVRFTSPVFPGNDLHLKFYEAGSDAFVFEARCDETEVITDGRVELVPTS